VEGNHELAYHNERIGWVEMLAARQLIILLHPKFEENGVRLSPYNNREGSYCDPLPGLRVHGLRYVGSSVAPAIQNYAEALAALPRDGIEYTIFVTHAGLEGVLPDQIGGLTHRQLAVLRPHVDYLALGHVHKPFEFDGWIYNPGSIETCAINEASWPERGYYLVEVDTARAQGTESLKHHVQLKASPRRPVHRLSVKTDLFTTPEALYDHCRELLHRKARDLRTPNLADKRPVVELQLNGLLSFQRSALNAGCL
jgi:DNA repair exonuclease SbcCD nuclease subunit